MEPEYSSSKTLRRYDLSRKEDKENRANQMNPNNDAYWVSRGYDGRPEDWEDRIERDDIQSGSRT